ncbi:uncharacterized protein LOC116299143 [Actinia tenebrosa]|uniref:Uncharacterized protein LOC116299143 n=1 Tax=Actinia tenebrosa TaxID=6105 RepID=A0A6P8IDN5_ACTTE|nr:uncharacterized protein LOC116299143 [Actinia tenebrosa]
MARRAVLLSSRFYLIFLMLFVILNSQKPTRKLNNHAIITYVSNGLDVKQFPSRNSRLSRSCSNKQQMPPSLKFKAGVFISKAGFLALSLVVLAGDVSVNPGPDALNVSFLSDTNSTGTDYESDLDSTSVEFPSDDEFCDPYPFFDLGLGNKGVRFGTWNVNRLTSSKFEQIKLFLLGRDNRSQVDVLALNETFLNSNVPDAMFSVPGFSTYRRDRIGKTGGGVMMFVNNSLNHRRRTDLEDCNLEVIWVEICPFKSKRPLLFAAVYRPPSYSQDMDHKLDKNIESAY